MATRLERAFDRMANASGKKISASQELGEAFEKKYGIDYGDFCEGHPKGDQFVEAYEYAAGEGFPISDIDLMVAEYKAAQEEFSS